MKSCTPGTGSLFDAVLSQQRTEALAPGALIHRGGSRNIESALLDAIRDITAAAPLRHLATPGGYRMSVAMTNCGALGWVSDQRGYRYATTDPSTGRAWPVMPQFFRTLAIEAAALAGYDFEPDACLINRYDTGTRLSLHRDYDERDADAPIVSVSIGVPAIFLWGGLSRKDRTRRILLESGDVVVWGGSSRFVYHGIAPLADNYHVLTGRQRFNLTFRKAG